MGEKYDFWIGQYQCAALLGGNALYKPNHYFANAPAEELAQKLAEYNLTSGDIPSPYTCMMADTGTHKIMVDTGVGDALLRNLEAQGIDPAQFDTVILTHGHPDHIGGNIDPEGRIAFPNARFVMSKAEWEYWTDDASLQRLPEVWQSLARKNILPLRERLDVIDTEGEIVPGVTAISAPGHTPGHMALAITSGQDELLYISDAALHQIHLDEPDWYPIFDTDPVQAIASRRKLFDRAAEKRSPVLAFHFAPFPSLGTVTGQNKGWRWQAFSAK